MDTIKAHELRNGDVLYVGGESYVLVARASTSRGETSVAIYNGTTANDSPTYRWPQDKEVRVSLRDRRP